MVEKATHAGGQHGTGLFPVARLTGAIGLAFDLRKLVVAFLGLMLLQSASFFLDRVFLGSAALWPDVFEAASTASRPLFQVDSIGTMLHRLSEPIRVLTSPLLILIKPGAEWGTVVHALLCVLSVLVVWGICGCAVARIAIAQAAKMRQTSIGEALRLSIRCAGTSIMAPVCPMLGLAFCATLGALFGLLYRLPTAGPALASVLFPVPLAIGFVMTVLVASLVAGWPLMVAAAAGGAENALDAWSRAFSYLNQRIGPLVACLAFLAIQGMIGLILVDLFTVGLIRITVWILGLTAPAGQPAALLNATGPSARTFAGMGHHSWLGVVILVAKSWAYSFFWTSAALLYLWSRHDVDGTPWTEIESTTAVPNASP